MKRKLRHPVRAIREPFGTAGLIVAIVALVAALGGAAYAAGHGALTHKQKKEVAKIAKKYAGKPGAQGPAGPQGLPGANGTNGEKGAKGDTGATGPEGPKGEKGDTGATGPEGPKGEKGDTGATGPEGPKGEKGDTGAEGPAGPEGNIKATLPSEKTETGTWALSPSAEGEPKFTSISFTIPLATGLDSEHVLKQGDAEFETHCPGGVSEPQAEKGYLCVYKTAVVNLENESILSPAGAPGAAKSGALLEFKAGAAGPRYGFGSWAVTAP